MLPSLRGGTPSPTARKRLLVYMQFEDDENNGDKAKSLVSAMLEAGLGEQR